MCLSHALDILQNDLAAEKLGVDVSGEVHSTAVLREILELKPDMEMPDVRGPGTR